MIEAGNQKSLADLRSRAKAKKVLKEAEAHKMEQQDLADTEAAIIRLNAQARLDVAKNRTAALIKESVAETAQSNNLEPKRRHDEKLHMVDALTSVAENGQMVVSNKNGQSVLNFYNNALDTVCKR